MEVTMLAVKFYVFVDKLKERDFAEGIVFMKET